MTLPRPNWCVFLAAAAALACLLPGTAMATDLPDGYSLRIVSISGPLGLADVAIDVVGPAPASISVVYGSNASDRFNLHPSPRRGGATFTGRLMLKPTHDDGMVSFSIGLQTRADSKPSVFGPFTFSAAPPPGHATPDWAKGAVWYQVFPERFRNANPANDPPAPAFFPTPWTADWYAFSPDELEAARARTTLEPPHLLRSLPDPRAAALQARRYGGDLEGLTEKLDEVRDLGITALYLNPVFAAHSHHKYDATDFRHIDPSLAGPPHALPQSESPDPATWQWTPADRYVLDTLLPAVHSRNMRIVFDGVWNHVGTRFWAFQSLALRGINSPYAPWFQAQFVDAAQRTDPRILAMGLSEGDLVSWKSWNGVNGSLPTFARNATTGRLHPDVEHHIWHVTRRWMSPAPGIRGIDGWRLDVAPDLPRPFWQAWAAHARSINPDAALLGEFWFDARDYFSSPDLAADPELPAASARPSIFDGQMNYPVAMPLVRWLADPSYSSTQLAAQLESILDRPPQHELVQMNLLASHDTARIATMIEAQSSEYNGRIPPRQQRTRPSESSFDKVVLGIAILACWPGSPMIYYGDEYGMHGGNDPHCRKPVPWTDAGAMENEADRPIPDLRPRFRSWLRLRQDPVRGDILRYGDARILPAPSPDVFAFERTLNNRRIILIANRADAPFDASSLIPGTSATNPTALIPARTAVLFQP